MIRRLGYNCNRLCTSGAVQDACAYFLAEKGLLHRIVATPTGGRVDAAPTVTGLPGWPTAPGPLATLIAVRNKPCAAENAPCLLACDGSSQLWVSDEAGEAIGGAIPLPLPHGYSAADGWEHWLAKDAAWAEASNTSSGRVDCVLLGYSATSCSTRRWSILVVSIFLPSATTEPSLTAAAMSTQAEPLYVRCGATPATVRCLLVVPQQRGCYRGDDKAAPSTDCIGVNVQGSGDEALHLDRRADEEEASEIDRGQDQDQVQGLATVDNYSAVEIRPNSIGSMELVLGHKQELNGFRPMVNPSCQELRGGGVILCTTSRPLSLRHAPTEQPLLVDPHAQVFDWLDPKLQSTETTGHSSQTTETSRATLLHHAVGASALGYVCSARPQRRFVVLSRQHSFALVAENRQVTVFALSLEVPAAGANIAGAGQSDERQLNFDACVRSRSPQQVYQFSNELGDLVGLTLVDYPKADEPLYADPVHSFSSGGSGSPQISNAAAVMLVLGTNGASAVQLQPPTPRDSARTNSAALISSSAASESEEMKALRLRALELLAGDGEW